MLPLPGIPWHHPSDDCCGFDCEYSVHCYHCLSVSGCRYAHWPGKSTDYPWVDGTPLETCNFVVGPSLVKKLSLRTQPILAYSYSWLKQLKHELSKMSYIRLCIYLMIGSLKINGAMVKKCYFFQNQVVRKNYTGKI